mgnify:CR=1 FL=1
MTLLAIHQATPNQRDANLLNRDGETIQRELAARGLLANAEMRTPRAAWKMVYAERRPTG